MLKRLRNQMLLLCLSMITIVMAVAFSIIYLDTYRTVINERDERLDAIEQHFNSPAAFVFEGSPRARRIRIQSPVVNFAQSFIMLADDAGELTYLYSYIDLPEEEYRNILQTIWTRENTQGMIEIENRLWQYRISERSILSVEGGLLFFGRSGEHTISFVDISESNQMLRNLLLTFIVVGLLALIVIFFLSLYISNRSIRPVEESLKRQKQFVSNASHELKTPLAIIAANTEALLANGEDTINSQKKWIGYIQQEIHGMGKLIGDMLYLAKTEDASAVSASVDFSYIAEHTATVMEALLFERNIALTLDIAPGIEIEGDLAKLTQLVRILMDNAAKYTEPQGEIWINLSRAKNNIVFIVKNTGKGISPKDLPHIFERFYRAAEDSNGTGLGLAIAKAIVEHMGGTISASSGDGVTVFEVWL